MSDMTKKPSSSTMRDHLARERTFLSWIRTAIAFMAFGVALEKFSLFLNYIALEAGIQEPKNALIDARLLALTLIVLGGVIAIAGAVRTEQWARCTGTIENQPKSGALLSLAAIVGLVAVMLTIHVLLTHS